MDANLQQLGGIGSGRKPGDKNKDRRAENDERRRSGSDREKNKSDRERRENE